MWVWVWVCLERLVTRAGTLDYMVRVRVWRLGVGVGVGVLGAPSDLGRHTGLHGTCVGGGG